MDHQTYNPCRNGLHICGADKAEESPVTVANFPLPRRLARPAFEQLKANFGEDEGDMVVDLMEDGDTMDDFWIRRQMLDRLSADIEALRQS